MPRCPKGSCRAWFDSQREFREHLKTHRKPRQDSIPEQERCPNCRQPIARPFAHYNGCP